MLLVAIILVISTQVVAGEKFLLLKETEVDSQTGYMYDDFGSKNNRSSVSRGIGLDAMAEKRL